MRQKSAFPSFLSFPRFVSLGKRQEKKLFLLSKNPTKSIHLIMEREDEKRRLEGPFYPLFSSSSYIKLSIKGPSFSFLSSEKIDCFFCRPG